MKKFRRFLSLAIGFAMLVSAFATMTAVSAAELEVYDPDYDFVRDGYTVYPGFEDYIETLSSYDGHTNVIHIKENNGSSAIASKIFDETLQVGKYNFSFDFKSDTYKGSSSTGEVAYIDVRSNPLTSMSTNGDFDSGWNRWSFGTDSTGFMRCFETNGAINDTYGTMTDYKNNVWYHIDCVYNYDESKIQLYCDGENFATRPITSESANAFIIDIRQSAGSKGAKGNVYFSNVKVNALGNQKITAAYDLANSTDSAISVKFSEKINDASGLKVVDSETLETVSTSATINGLTATIPVSNLKYGAEYRITIPEGITGLLGGTTTAQEILFNTADVTGSFGAHVFSDDFESYTAMKNAGDTDSEGLADVWGANVSGNNYALGRYIYQNGDNKVLSLRGWWSKGAKSIIPYHAFEKAYTDGRIEYNFDMAVNDPDANDALMGTDQTRMFSFVLKRADGTVYDTVFTVKGNKISLGSPVGWDATADEVTTFNMPNNLTDMVSFKVVTDLTNGKIKTYVKQENGNYLLLNNDPNGATYNRGGTSAFGFKLFRGSSTDTLIEDTSMLIDNVTVDIGEPPMSAVVKKVRLGDDELTSKDSSAATTDIKVYFNQNMDTTTLNNISIDAADGSAVDKDVTYDADTYCATLKLKGMLKAKTAYTINVPTTVKTADGRALARAYAGAFTTGEGTLFVSNPTLKNGDLDATKENTKAGDTLTAKVSVINQTGSSDDLVLILAAYDGDKLIDLKYDPKAYTAADTNFELTTTYTIPENVGDLNVQVMLWNGFGKMMPVKGAITLE